MKEEELQFISIHPDDVDSNGIDASYATTRTEDSVIGTWILKQSKVFICLSYLNVFNLFILASIGNNFSSSV